MPEAIFQGQAPSDVLNATDVSTLSSRSGFGLPTSASADSLWRGPKVRQSIPGVGGRSRLGGVASFQALAPIGMVERGRQRLAEYESDTKGEDMTLSIFQRALEHRCDEIDRQRDGKLNMPPPELADYTLELMNNKR